MSGKDLKYMEHNENIFAVHYTKEIPNTSISHIHKSYEIFYNICGARGFILDGKFYRCKKRDLVVIPRLHTHNILINNDQGYERCIIRIDETVINMITSISGTLNDLKWMTEGDDEAPKVVNLSPEQNERYVKMIDEYIKIKSGDNFPKSFSMFMYILAFLKEVFYNKGKAECIGDGDISHIDKVLKYIELNFKDATVFDIAKINNIDRGYLYRLFKREMNIGIKSYMIIRKLTEAKRWIYLGKTVKEACCLSGFSNYANFARTFKKYEGYPPSKI